MAATSAARTTGVTPRQTAVLAAIRASIVDRGYPPTVREIGRAVGGNASSIAYQLGQLEAKGLIRRNPKSSRGIALVDTGRAASTSTLTPERYDTWATRYRDAMTYTTLPPALFADAKLMLTVIDELCDEVSRLKQYAADRGLAAT